MGTAVRRHLPGTAGATDVVEPRPRAEFGIVDLSRSALQIHERIHEAACRQLRQLSGRSYVVRELAPVVGVVVDAGPALGTIGSRISRGLPRICEARGLYRRLGISPYPED